MKYKWPTLEGRLNQPHITRCEALAQMERNGDILSDLAKKYLHKCRQAAAKKRTISGMGVVD